MERQLGFVEAEAECFVALVVVVVGHILVVGDNIDYCFVEGLERALEPVELFNYNE